MPETADGRCTLVIAEVAAALNDTHLEFIGIWTSHEHIHVIVGFHDHCVGLARKGNSLIRHTSHICHYHELVAFHLDRIAYRLRGIMRNHEITDLHSCYFSPFPFRKDPAAWSDRRSSEGMAGQCIMDDLRCIDRLCKTLAERTKMTDMVQVVMRDKHSRKGIHIKFILQQHLLQTTQADTGIYDDASVFRTEIIAVAAASARKTHELHHQHTPSILNESSPSTSASRADRSVPGS